MAPKFNVQEALAEMRKEQRADHEALTHTVNTGFEAIRKMAADHEVHDVECFAESG